MAEEKTISIPVVDFSVLSLDKNEIPCDSDQRVQQVAAEICKAFSDIGFVYLKNHGISDNEVRFMIDGSFFKSKKWFSKNNLVSNVKTKFSLRVYAMAWILSLQFLI